MPCFSPASAVFCAFLVATSAHATTQVTVWAFGASEKDFAQHVSQELGRLSGVAQSAVTEVVGDHAKLQVTMAQGDGRSLAKAISDAPAVALQVEQSASDRLVCRVSPPRNARLPFTVKAFEDRSKDKSLGKVSALAAESARLLLRNAPFLSETSDPDKAFLVFSGRVNKNDKVLIYEMRVLRRKGGEISYAKGKGEAALSEICQQLVKGLPVRLAELEGAVFQKDAALMALPRVMERSNRASAFSLIKAEGNIDPNQAGAYGTTPVATLWFETGRTISSAIAHATVEGLSPAARENPPIELKGAAAKLPVLAILDAQKLKKASVPAIAPLKVDVTYRDGDFERVATFIVPLRVGAL